MYVLSLISKLHEQKTLYYLTKIIVGSSILSIFAQISIPLPFVPITGQSLGLLLISFTLGRSAAVASVLLYISKGIIGIPVFANFSFGLPILLGSSGGYLIGFIPAAYLLGYCSDKGYLNSIIKTSIFTILATIIIFMFGLIQLSIFIPLNNLLDIGLYPFIIGAISKGIIAISISTSLYK